MSDIALIQYIYDRLGLQQQSLAKLLQIHHSILNRILLGTRQLPIKATFPLVQIHAIAHQLPSPCSPMPTAADNKVVAQQLVTCQIHLHQLQKQLRNMQQLYNEGIDLQQFVQVYTPTLSNITPKQQRLLEQLVYEANKKITANAWLPQQQLLLKIKLLQTEIVHLKNQISDTIT